MTPAEFRALLVSYEPQLRADLGKLWVQAQTMSAPEFSAYAQEAYPELVSPHIALAAELAATWYDEASPQSSYIATVAALPPVEQLQASLRWALSKPDSPALLNGSAERMFYLGARSTIVDNSETEHGATWAREAQPGACWFCRLLATRGAVYASESAALQHGTGQRRRRLAPAKHEDDKYHDNCKCIAVMVRPGGSYTPPAYAEKWNSEYEAAVKAAGGAQTFEAVKAGYKLLGAE